MIHLSLLLLLPAFARPDSLGELVALALTRHPEVTALEAKNTAAEARGMLLSRPMGPEWMLGVEGLGAMPDSPDPTMLMIGVQQMFLWPGIYALGPEQARLEQEWLAAARLELEVELAISLWESAARVRFFQDSTLIFQEQLAQATFALQLQAARHQSGQGSSIPSTPLFPSEMSEPDRAAISPQAVPGGMSGGMSGMSGSGMPGMSGSMGSSMSGMSGSMGSSMSGMSGSMGSSMSGMSGNGMSGSGMPGSAGSGLTQLLLLELAAQAVELELELLALKLQTETQQLALMVGAEGAEAVLATPEHFLGGMALASPERAYSEAAEALAWFQVRQAQVERRPGFMLGTSLRLMPDGMPDGVNAELGVSVPLGSRYRLEAAEAEAQATESESERIQRELLSAKLKARQVVEAEELKFALLSKQAIPRAEAAWNTSLSLWAAGEELELVAAWQLLTVSRQQAVEAELNLEFARASLVRLEAI
jgi:hypothetical protein